MGPYLIFIWAEYKNESKVTSKIYTSKLIVIFERFVKAYVVATTFVYTTTTSTFKILRFVVSTGKINL